MDQDLEIKLAVLKKQYDEFTSQLDSLKRQADSLMDDPRLMPTQRYEMLSRLTSEARRIEEKRRAVVQLIDLYEQQMGVE